MATLTIDKTQRSLLDPVEEAAPAVRPERRAAAAPATPAVPAASRASDRATLDDVVARTWSALLGSRTAPCLLCGGEVAPRYGTGAHPVGGACRSCGTEIA